MNKILFVGDMHVVPEEIEECQKLLDYVLELALLHKASVCFLGDQHHTHSVVRLEVLKFWRDNFENFQQHNICTVALVGNHDLSNAHCSKEHAMLAYQDLVHVIDGPDIIPEINEYFMFLPYYHSNEEFIRVCKINYDVNNLHTVICHQTFNGAIYEKGFYAKDGVEVSEIPQTQIISGHIHTYFSSNKLLYVGSPRWRTFTDANVEKFLILMTYQKDGTPESFEKFPTDKVCRKIVTLTEEEFLQDPNLDRTHQKVHLIIEDTKDKLIQKKSLYSKKGFLIKGVIKENSKHIRVRESEGIKTAFRKYFDQTTHNYQTPRKELISLIRSRLFTDFYESE